MPDVTPGKQFAVNEKITRAKLNQLANPVVTINDADTTAMVAAVRQANPYIGRNVLINGDFDVWQRGGFANISGLPNVMGAGTGAAMGTDRWALNEPSGSNKRNVYRGDFTPGQSVVPGEPEFYLRWNELVAETGVNRPMLSQYIEDARTLSGKSCVATWWMQGDYSGNVTCQLIQFTGGSPGQTVTVAATSGGTASLINGAAWTKYTATFAVPSVAGYALTTGSYLALQFLLPDNATFQIDFAQVQLEEGATATDFEAMPYLETLRKCERYFEYHGGVAWDDITHGSPCYYFATRKYRAPTLSLIAGYSGTMTAANFSTILDIGYYQDTANSAVSVFYIACEAEISMP